MGSGGVLLVKEFVMVARVILLVLLLACDLSRISRVYLMGFVLAHTLIIVNVVALECRIVYRDIGDFGRRRWKGVRLGVGDVAGRLLHRSGIEG